MPGLSQIAGKSAGCVCPTPSVPCSPCSIPEQNLVLSWQGFFTGSAPLTFNGTAVWNTGPVTVGTQTFYGQLQCVLGLICLTWGANTLSGDCGNCPGSAWVITLKDYTCSPFHLHFDASLQSCPPFAVGTFTDLYVDL